MFTRVVSGTMNPAERVRAEVRFHRLRRLRRAVVLVLLPALLPLVAAVPARGAGAVLDDSFGDSGTTRTRFPSREGDEGITLNAAARVKALVRQSDNKLVAAGTTGFGWGLARYGQDGSLDTGFGTDGRVTAFDGGGSVNAVLIQKVDLEGQIEERILAVGTDGSSGGDFVLARYMPNGSLDNSFGAGNGTATTNFGGDDVALAVAVQPDGRIVVAGRANDGPEADFALARYTAAGLPDPAFGVGGIVVANLGGSDVAHALALLLDDQGSLEHIVVAGRTTTQNGNDMALARFTRNGLLDTTFGAANAIVPEARPEARTGTMTIDFGDDNNHDEGANAVLAHDDHLILAGYKAADGNCEDYPGGENDTTGCRFALARVEADGSALDAEFSGDGLVATDLEFRGVKALTLQDAGDGPRLVAAGGNAGDLAVARYNQDGSLDDVITTDLGGFEAANAVLVDDDSRLVVAGYAGDDRDLSCGSHSFGCQFLLARYIDGSDQSEMTLSLIPDRTAVAEGETVTYTATATNVGASGAQVKLINQVPSGAILTDARSGAKRCPATVEQVTCSFGIVPPGGTVTATVTLVATRPGTLANAVRAVGPLLDISVPAAPVAVRRGAGVWKPVNGLGQGRSGHTATRLDGPECQSGAPLGYCGKVLVVGGHRSASGDHPNSGETAPPPLASVELFDPASETWATSGRCGAVSSACPAPLQNGRGDHTATLLSGPRCGEFCGHVLVVGQRAVDRPFVTPELYNPKTGEWRLTTPLPDTPRDDATATLLEGPGCADKCGMVLIAGGEVGRSGIVTRTTGYPAWLFDPATQAWIRTSTLNDPRAKHVAVLLNGVGCASHCGQVLVAGGENGCSGDPNCAGGLNNNKTAELYDPSTNTWKPAGELAVPRQLLAATVLGGPFCAPVRTASHCGQVLVSGGSESESLGITNDAQRYDPPGSTWLITRPLPMSRTRHTATSLADGAVLITGGACCTDPVHPAVPTATLFELTTVEPTTSRWVPAASLTTGRRAHTATTLRDGRVLVVGGWTGAYGGHETPALSSAEVYTPRPLITAIAPDRGPGRGDTPVTITGQGLSSVTEVRFGGVTATPDSVSDVALLVRTPPAQRVGVVDVVVDGPLGASVPHPAARFTYTGVPGIPRLAAVPVSDTEVELAFGAVGADGALPPPIGSYVIRESSVPITEANLAGADVLCICSFEPAAVGERLTQKVAGLDPGTEYHYAVQAVAEDGTRGPLSNSVAVTTLGHAAKAAAAGADGYRLVGADGGVFSFGGARFLGSTGSIRLNQPMVGMASTPSGDGYWLVARDGGVFAFGGARFFGSTGAMRLNQPVVGMASTPSGNGYWLVAGDGGVFAFGDARFLGSTGAIRLNKPMVGMAAMPSGRGYRLVGADGGVFAFGDARFLGSTGAIRLNQPMVGAASTPSGNGYWLVASDGGVFAFGDARFFGSTGAIPLNKPMVAMSGGRAGLGYRLVGADGGVFAFGAAPFLGSTGALRLNQPIVGMAAIGR